MADLNKKILGETSESLSDLAKNVKDTTEKYITLEGIIPKVITEFKNQTEETRNLNKELGNGSKVSAELRLEMSKLSSQFGISTNAQLKLLNITKSYHQSLNETSATTLKFIKASGASTKEVAVLSAKMQILGNASESTFSDMYERILSVRDAYGLTSEQIDSISNTMTKLTTIVGLNSDEIVRASENISVFTSKLTSAGVEAETVTGILNKLTDFDTANLSNNMMLLSKMGLTMSDIAFGNATEKLEESIPRLKKIGTEITSQQNLIIANEMAKVYGITLETAREFANLDTTTKVLDREKNLAQYRAEVSTLKDNIENSVSVLAGAVLRPVNKLIAFVEPFITKFTDLISGIGKYGETLGIVVSGIISNKIIKLTKNIVTKAISLINIIKENLSESALNFAKIFGSTSGNLFSEAITSSMKEYLGEVEKRDQIYQNDRKNAENKVSSNLKESAEPVASLLNEKSKKQVAREQKEKDFNLTPDEERLARIQELFEEVSTEEFEYQERLNELRNKSYNNTLTKLEIEELKATEGLKDSFTAYKKSSLEALKDSINKLSGLELDVSKHYETLYKQLSEYTDEEFSAKKDEALASIKLVLKNNEASKYIDQLSLEELKDVINPSSSDNRGISQKFASIFENKKASIENEKLSIQKKYGGDILAYTKDEEYIKLNGKIAEITQAIENLNSAVSPTDETFIDLDKTIKEVTQNQENYSNKIKDAINNVNSTTAKESAHSVLGSVAGTVAKISKKITPYALIATTIGTIGYKLISETEKGQEITESISNHVDNIKKSIGEKLAVITEGPLNFINKTLGKIDNSVNKLNDTSGYDLKTLTLAYATADSIKNGQMYASQREMNESLTRVINEIKTVGKNIDNVGGSLIINGLQG